MYRRGQTFFGSIIAIYIGLYFVSPQIANFCLAVFFILLIPALILRYFFMDSLYKGSISIVPKRFVFNKNTIYNEHCTVKYFQDEKIVVLDNVANKKLEKRTFTITKEKNKVNVNKCWNEVCKIFDAFISLDSLASFYSYETKVDIITIKSTTGKDFAKKDNDIKIDSTNTGAKFVEMGAIQPDPYSRGLEHQRPYDEKFVNIDNIHQAEKTRERDIEAPQFIDLSDALDAGPNKIDVNNSGADEIAVLPGINNVTAKTIVQYRAANGLFKDADDFIKVANVKEHFISKIKSMIVIGEPKKADNGGDDDQGRIVDI